MKKREAIIITALICAILAICFLLNRRVWFRVDLTRNKAYTLSPVSRKLYQEIDNPVRITYYLSDRLAGIHPVPKQIEDLLREFAAYSRGAITVNVRDPAKAGLVDTIESMGITPQQMQLEEEYEASVSTVYSGIIIEYLDRFETLPIVFSLSTLEYDISSRIRSMIRDTSREIGVLAAELTKTWQEDYAYLNQAFYQAGYGVRQIQAGDEISENLSMLLVIGGAEELEEWDLYHIDRYIQSGGKALFALNSVVIDMERGLEARPVMDSGLLTMLSCYGADLRPALVLDHSALTLPLQSRGPGGSQIRLMRYPLWISVLPRFGNPDHPITSNFNGVDLFWTNPIELNPPDGVSAEPLFTSTPDAWLQTRDFMTNPEMPYLMTREEPDTRGPRILAAALSGVFPGFFRDMPKPEREGFAGELPDMPEQGRPARIVVLGGSDMATTLIQYTRSGRNMDFILQITDWLGNDDDIISIRNRVPRLGRLDRITDPVKRKAAMTRSQAVNLVVVPLAVVAAGLLHAWRRKKRNRVKE